MTDSFTLTVVLYALLLAGLLTVTAATGRPRPRPLSAGLLLLGAATGVQALLDAATLWAGPTGGGLATHVGYLLTSLGVLPASAAAVRSHPGRWGNAAFAAGCALLAVVSVRLHQTLPAVDRG